MIYHSQTTSATKRNDLWHSYQDNPSPANLKNNTNITIYNDSDFFKFIDKNILKKRQKRKTYSEENLQGYTRGKEKIWRRERDSNPR